VLAKLDRLSDSLAFISMLVDRKVDFVCCNSSTAFDAPDTYEEPEAAKDASSAKPRDP
jgi:hypothetical protein